MAGYEEQLERVRRYYARFRKLNDGMEHTAATDEYIDDVYAFFMHCHHLKDWLQKDPAYTKHTHRQIDNHVKHTQVLAICADICNAAKHFTLGRRCSGGTPRMGKGVGEVNLCDGISGEELPTTIKLRLSITHGGKERDAFQLATDALRSWESFIG